MREKFSGKRRAILLFLALGLLLSACAPPPIPPPPPGAEPIEKPKDLEGVFRLMVGTGFLPDMSPVPDGLIASSYGIVDAWMADALFMIPQDPLLADEIILIRAMSESDAEEILTLLSRRLAQKETAAKDNAPDQYAIIMDARLIHQGRELALIVSDKAGELVKVYEENWPPKP